MLSFENAPQDPPPLLLKSDDTVVASHKLSFQTLPSFSIRDYVFTVRNTNIEKTWPFSHHHLQQCSHHHQINHILPPFEPPESVRKHILTKGTRRRSHQPTSQIVTPTSLEPQHKSTLRPGSSHSHHALQTPQYPISNENLSSSQSNPHLHTSQLLIPSHNNESSLAPSGRKCRLILKLTSPSHPTPTEDITSNTTAISDSMTSKLCPVCKTFSSTSNTTLNAHIDQCLVLESTSKWIAANDTESTKHIPKPTKKRSMVDIYETAPRCTLEELDRRNGSNWAADSCLLTTEPNANVCEKMQRLSVAALEESNDEYPVYFDSTGTKIRIISKFSNTSIPTPKAGYGPRKLAENGEDSKVTSYDVKRNGRRHNTKPRSMKISEVQERNHRKGKDSGKEDHLSQIARARHGIKPSQSGTLRRLVCSKRTNPLMRVNDKNNCQDLRSSSSILTVDRNKVNFCNSSLEGSLILSSPLESAVSSSETTNADSSFYETQVNESGTGFHMVSEKTCNLLRKARTSSRRGGGSVKHPKSSGTCASSPRSKRVEIDANPAENRDSCAKDNESILSNELVNKLTFSNLKFKMNTKVPTLKKPRTHRSIAEMENQVEAKSDVEEQYDCVHDSAEDLPGSSWRGASHNLDGSSAELRLEVEVIDQFSITGAGALVPRRGEAMRISERRKAITNEEASCSGMHCQDLDVDTTFESHVRAPFQNLYCSKKYTDNFNCLAAGSGDIPVNIDTLSFSRKADGSPMSKTCNTFPSEISNLPHSSDAHSNSLHSSGEHKGCVCGTKTAMPSVQQKWTDSQVTLSVNRNIQDSEVASEDNSQLVGISFSEVQCTRYGTDPQSVPASLELLLPSLWDLNSEHLQEKSSLSSNKMPFGQGSHVPVHRDPSESPVSAISTNSHHTIPRTNSKFLDPEACSKPSAVQDRLVLGFSGGSAQPVVGNATSSLFMIRAGKAEIINAAGESFRETTISPTEDCVKFNDDETCCCFWQKSSCFDAASVYQDPLLIKDTRGSSMVSANGKHLPCDTNIRSEIFVNTNSFPSSRINDVVAPICESQRGLISHSSADGAHRLTSLDGTSPGLTFSQVQDDQCSSNPVLRLMGKNLMVVNKDEDISGKHRQPPPGSTNTCGGTTYMDLFRFSPSVSDQDCVSEDSVILNQGSCHRQRHFLDDDLSKGFNHICSTTQQKGPMVVNQNVTDLQGFDSNTRWNGLERRASLQIKQKQNINKMDMYPFIIAPADLQRNNPPSSVQVVGNRMQEVIVIDDSPEGPDESSKRTIKQTGEAKRSQESPAVGVVPSNQSIHQRSGGFSFHTSSNSLSRSGVISRRKLVQLPSVVPWERKGR